MLSLENKIERNELIVSDFNNELKRIRHGNAGFLLKFINERICNFEREKAEMIIPEWLLDQRKNFSVRFPYSPANEKLSIYEKSRNSY